jgi:polyphosphate kinase 2 (PPK2 family)
MLGGMNPAGCKVVGFKRPKPEELDHDFLWRVHPHLPAKGEVRSSIDPTTKTFSCGSPLHRPTYGPNVRVDQRLERLLVTENDTTVLKFFLYPRSNWPASSCA